MLIVKYNILRDSTLIIKFIKDNHVTNWQSKINKVVLWFENHISLKIIVSLFILSDISFNAHVLSISHQYRLVLLHFRDRNDRATSSLILLDRVTTLAMTVILSLRGDTKYQQSNLVTY